MIHVDIWGPSRIASHSGRRYFLTVVDDYSRYVDITFLRNKSDAFTALQAFTAKAETQTGLRLKSIRSDGGGKFASNKAQAWYQDKGI